MKIFDMHVHTRFEEPNPKALLEHLDKAGIYGTCVFSYSPCVIKPGGAVLNDSITFDERLEKVLGWSRGYEDRIYPVMWIHPDEENILENVEKAVKAGIVAFKMICSNYYPYEEKCMRVLRKIASLDKPVIFHTGILWDGCVSSIYNRPLNFEALIDITGLRFSLGHCSWPWIDECISLYGKFLYAYTQRDDASEMYFDLTPGTPDIYREELLTKLYTIGYNVGDNIMFGTDCNTAGYSLAHATGIISQDNRILEKLGVSRENVQKMYHDNFMRFLGLNKSTEVNDFPSRVNFLSWNGKNPEVPGIIEKWYKKLGFDKGFDAEFYKALKTVPVSDTVSANTYDVNCEDGKRNFLSFLFMCEKLSEDYKKRGISEEILLDTLNDIKEWLNVWSEIKGELYLGECAWLIQHMRGNLYKLGCLEYCFEKAAADKPELGIAKGDNIIGVHIPANTDLSPEACEKSLNMAREFFAKYYPEYEFKYFSCHSWLLDETLAEILPESSNIVKFGNMFGNRCGEETEDIIRYVFGWNVKKYQIKKHPCSTTLANKIRERYAEGGKFYTTRGYIKK